MDKYINPLNERYASSEMSYIFSPNFKFKTWRKLWVVLAETERELGLDFITKEQIQELKDNIENIDFEKANEFEKKLRHDVMAHVHAYGEVAPNARSIIHLGVTSAYVGDNTDLIQIMEGLKILKTRMINLMDRLKRFCLEYRIENLRFRGVKGTTGTQASFKELFSNDFEKVKELDNKVCEKMGFSKKQTVSGQTYDRKTDLQILNLLGNIAQSAHKFTNDFRLLQHLKELEEPFAKNQIGSSAMAYKRNPMRSERISSIAKFVMSLTSNGSQVASTQWFERTLDDSANKRLSIPQAFLGVDAILLIWLNILDGVVVYPKVIESNIMKELPFMATENIIMESVKKGMDRQDVHEIIRELSMEETKSIKLEGKPNNLIDRIIKDGRLSLKQEDLKNILIPSEYTGFASQQTMDFIENDINPILEKYKDLILEDKVEIEV